MDSPITPLEFICNPDGKVLITGHHTTGCLYAMAADMVVIEHSPRRFTLLPANHTQYATKQNALNSASLDLLDAVMRARFLGLSKAEIATIVVKLLAPECAL